MTGIDNITSLFKIKEYGSASNNALILGENYKVLKLLQKKYKNKIQCIYADPPYNTCQSFDAFEDSMSQKKWLSTMKKRLKLLRSFLSNTGSLWISIDDNEFAYLKVLCDEIFGVENYISTIVRKKNKFPSSTERFIVHMHDYLLVYAKNSKKVRFNNFKEDIQYKEYFDSNNWNLINMLIRCTSLPNGVKMEDYIYRIKTPSNEDILPPKGRCWRVTKEKYKELQQEGKIWFDGKDPFPYEKKAKNDYSFISPTTIWGSELVDSNQTAREEISRYNSTQFFYVPKPEKMLKTILEISTNPGDYVLDPYLGSGTTAVVASKMHRQWIGIEKEKYQCENICLQRLKDTIDGNESSSINDSLSWTGGWGFSYYKI